MPEALPDRGAPPPADKSLKECNAVDMCMDWSPCYVSNPPAWVNGVVDVIL
jgi:hypothetical protein